MKYGGNGEGIGEVESKIKSNKMSIGKREPFSMINTVFALKLFSQDIHI